MGKRPSVCLSAIDRSARSPAMLLNTKSSWWSYQQNKHHQTWDDLSKVKLRGTLLSQHRPCGQDMFASACPNKAICALIIIHASDSVYLFVRYLTFASTTAKWAIRDHHQNFACITDLSPKTHIYLSFNLTKIDFLNHSSFSGYTADPASRDLFGNGYPDLMTQPAFNLRVSFRAAWAIQLRERKIHFTYHEVHQNAHIPCDVKDAKLKRPIFPSITDFHSGVTASRCQNLMMAWLVMKPKSRCHFTRPQTIEELQSFLLLLTKPNSLELLRPEVAAIGTGPCIPPNLTSKSDTIPSSFGIRISAWTLKFIARALDTFTGMVSKSGIGLSIKCPSINLPWYENAEP